MKIKKAVIEDVCDFVGGSQPPKSVFKYEFKENYIRFIQTRDYKSNNFLTYIPVNTARRFCSKEDIMIGRYGPPIFQILRGIEGAYNVALMKAVPKPNIINDYLYYLLKQEAIFKYVDGLSLRTGGQTGVDVDSLNKYPVLLPEITYQQRVVNILKTLDLKIELNSKINAELEGMAKTLYDYWFVQFDFPNTNGKPYKASGGQMVYNEELKRLIPKGWDAGTLASIGEITGGSTPSRENDEYFSNKGTAWITPKDLSLNSGNKFISKGELDVTDAGIKSASLNVMPKGTILLSSRAPIGYMAISRDIVTTNQGFKSFVVKKDFSSEFVYYTVKDLIPSIANNAVGSTFKEVSGATLKSIPVCLPDNNIVKRYTELVQDIFMRQDVLEDENQKLSELRDWLLPMLMNGQVKVDQAIKEVIKEERKPVRVNQTQWQTLLLARYINSLKDQKPKPILQGEVGIAKYAYLADKIFNVGSGFKYKQHNFGPYDSAINDRLSSKKYFQKTGDRFYKVFDLTVSGEELAGSSDVDFSKADMAMKELTAIFSKFTKDKAHKLELMASICWQIEKQRSISAKKIWQGFKNWKIAGRKEKHKAEVFTEVEVKNCLKTIVTKGWHKKLVR